MKNGIWRCLHSRFTGEAKKLKLRKRLLGLDSLLTGPYKPHPLPWTKGHKLRVGFQTKPLDAIWKSWKHFGRSSRVAVRDSVSFFVIYKVNLLNFKTLILNKS